MNAFKNIAITISAGFEQLASKLENHQAIATTMISELETAVAEVKVQRGVIQRDREQLNNRIASYIQEKERWTERVKKVYESDEQKALECVRRIKQLEEAISVAQTEEKTIASLEVRLIEQLHTIETKLGELQRKKVDLVTRQYCADAISKASNLSSDFENNFSNIFTRWETDITRKEIHAKTIEPENDVLDKQFSEVENHEELLQMLHRITGKDSIKQH